MKKARERESNLRNILNSQVDDLGNLLLLINIMQELQWFVLHEQSFVLALSQVEEELFTIVQMLNFLLLVLFWEYANNSWNTDTKGR